MTHHRPTRSVAAIALLAATSAHGAARPTERDASAAEVLIPSSLAADVLIDPPASSRSTAPTAPTPTLLDLAEGWHVRVEPLLWFVAPSGNLKLPVNSGSGRAGFTTSGDKLDIDQLNLDSTRLRPMGVLTVSSGDWRFTFTGADYELSRSGTSTDVGGRLGTVAFAKGDRINLDFDFGTYELTAGYRVLYHDFRAASKHSEDAANVVVFAHVFGGVRMYDVDISAESFSPLAPARSEEHNLFFEPLVGIRGEAVLADDFSVVIQTSVGALPLYDTQSYSIDVALAFEWRPTPNVGIELGWRQLAFTLTDGRELDRFRYTGRLAGLFTGVVIRF